MMRSESTAAANPPAASSRKVLVNDTPRELMRRFIISL